MMLDENRLKVFIEGTNRYFKKISNIDVTVGSPYFMEGKSPIIHDFTGIITISGPYTGKVYFSAPKRLLRYILVSIGEINNNSEHMLDLVGEIANTISGNARSEFGSEFLISPPRVVEGQIDPSTFPDIARSFIIPLVWKKYDATLVVCLKES